MECGSHPMAELATRVAAARTARLDLTDSLVAMTAPFTLRRADFPLALPDHRNPCQRLISHVVMLLNRRHAAGVVCVEVKAHCGEPLNEAADALASAAAESLRQMTVRFPAGSAAPGN